MKVFVNFDASYDRIPHPDASLEESINEVRAFRKKKVFSCFLGFVSDARITNLSLSTMLYFQNNPRTIWKILPLKIALSFIEFSNKSEGCKSFNFSIFKKVFSHSKFDSIRICLL